jgi:hypothetical protein
MLAGAIVRVVQRNDAANASPSCGRRARTAEDARDLIFARARVNSYSAVT